MREVYAAFLILMGLPFLVLSMGAALQPESAQFHKLSHRHSVIIEKATKYIDEFKANNSRLPSTEEFNAWMQNSDKHSGTSYEGSAFDYSKKPFPSSITKGFGTPPSDEDAFVFSFLSRGTFDNYYASWSTNKNVEYVPDSVYFVFGSKFADVIVFFLFYCAIASVTSQLFSYNYSQFKRAFITVFIISFTISALIILAISPLVFQVKN